MNDILQKTTGFAKSAHGPQRRKFVDEPYVNHLVRVMNICSEYTNDIPTLCAALLHDVLEDTDTTKQELLDYLHGILDHEQSQRTMTLVEELTDIYTKKNYPRLNRRQRKNKEATRLAHSESASQTIKYADIIDNSSDILNAEPDFAKLFLYECRNLLKVMIDGNAELRQRAIEKVESSIKQQQLSTHNDQTRPRL